LKDATDGVPCPAGAESPAGSKQIESCACRDKAATWKIGRPGSNGGNGGQGPAEMPWAG